MSDYYIGCVERYDARRGYGFVKVLSEGDRKDSEYFCHHSGLSVSTDDFKRLYPGEYVRFKVGKGQDDRDTCQSVTGPEGGPLLCENPRYRYKYFPKGPPPQRPQDRDRDDQVKENQTDDS